MTSPTQRAGADDLAERMKAHAETLRQQAHNVSCNTPPGDDRFLMGQYELRKQADNFDAFAIDVAALQARIAELEARNAASERDAGRYRWLREQGVRFNLSPKFWTERLDAAIDAATPVAQGGGEWYCPTCRCVVQPRDVTYSEQHEACGTAVSTTPAAPVTDGGDGLSAEQLAQWLDRKFARHGEEEDQQAAAMLRKLAALPARDAVRDALHAYMRAQRRMLDKWADGDDNVRRDLWRELHDCELPAAEALAALPVVRDEGEMLGWVHECVWEDGTSRTMTRSEPKPLNEPCAGLISQRVIRAYAAPPVAQERGQAVMAEVVGKVYRMEDGTCEVDWLLEGGIHAVGSDGDAYLYTMDIPEPEDGAIEVRLAAAAAERDEP